MTYGNASLIMRRNA